MVQQSICAERPDSRDGSFRDACIYGFIFLFGDKCRHFVLLYCHRACLSVGRDFCVPGVLGLAGMYLYPARPVRHDGSVAGGSCDGDGDVWDHPFLFEMRKLT